MKLTPFVQMVLLLFLVHATPLAQTSMVKPPSYLIGTVQDTNDSAVAGVTVTLERGVARHTVTTSEDGTFSIYLPVGTYRITANKRGFCSGKRGLFHVRPSTTTTLNIRLIVCPIVHSLTLDGGRYAGETARDQAPFQEEEFPIVSSEGPLSLLIQYGNRVRVGNSIHYRGFTISDGKCVGVTVTYDLLRIYADNVRFDAESLILEAQGNGILERGEERVKFKQIEVELKGGEPRVKIIIQK